MSPGEQNINITKDGSSHKYDDQFSTKAPSKSTVKIPRHTCIENKNNSPNTQHQHNMLMLKLLPFPQIKEKRSSNRVAIKAQIITVNLYKQQLEEKKRFEEEKNLVKKHPTYKMHSGASALVMNKVLSRNYC
ncbi:hypothetical protein ABEB36_004514 [Hypothenemus hampei]|uniref:Uncharacterized protein n=1 Tax=Hypothenemus hampei TaxID=57062 RepID=A0ABD1F3L0_HYPHA